jgi:sRNA-binding regulator protein Hfq
LEYFVPQSAVTVKKIFTITLHFSPYGKSAINVQTIFFKQFSYGEKSPGRAKDIFFIYGCKLRGFFPKKTNFGILLKNVQGIF